MKNTIKLFSLALVSLIMFSCSSDTETFPSSVPVPAATNLAETVKTIPSLSILSQAIEKAGLTETLATGGPFTLLAPSNSVLEEFIKTTPYGTLKYVPSAVLKDLLINHVITGDVKSSALIGNAGYTKTEAEDGSSNKLDIYYNGKNGGVTFNGVSNVTTPDVKATNGTIHIVDAVILPATITTFVTADPNYSTLAAAITRDSDFSYAQTLANASATFTLFAPTNEAFGALLAEDALKLDDLGQLPKSFLVSTINSHVISGSNVKSTDVINGLSISTLGATLTATVAGSSIKLKDPTDREANVIAPVDIQAVNGIIHTIDKVLVNAFPVAE